MLKLIVIAATLALSVYALTDYSVPKAVAKETAGLYLGKFLYASHWSLILYIITAVLFLVRKTGLRLAAGALRILLALSLPTQLLISLLFAYLFAKDPANFSNGRLVWSRIPTVSLAKHILPLISLFCIWHETSITLRHSMYYLNTAGIAVYGILTTIAQTKNKRWQYDFMQQMPGIRIFYLYLASALASALILSIIRIVDNRRRINRIRKNVIKMK